MKFKIILYEITIDIHFHKNVVILSCHLHFNSFIRAILQMCLNYRNNSQLIYLA